MVAHYMITLSKFTGRVGALIKGMLHRYTAEKCPAVRQYSIPSILKCMLAEQDIDRQQ
jgi:hypothetical protein